MAKSGLLTVAALISGIVLLGAGYTVGKSLKPAQTEPNNTAPIVIPDDFKPMIKKAFFIKTDRASIGQVTLQEAPNGVIARLELDGLPEGWHGMHFHVKADCSDTAFKNSGGHINPSGKEHGLMNPNGPDNADLPNIYVGADGMAMAEVFSDRVSLTGRGGRPALLDEDGSALVVHASPDDQLTQPIGGAGGRIACAVIE